MFLFLSWWQSLIIFFFRLFFFLVYLLHLTTMTFCTLAQRAVLERFVILEVWITGSCHLLSADYKYDSVPPQGKHINLDFDLHLFWCCYWHNSRPRCLISAGSSDELICISWNTLWEGDCVGHSNSFHWNTDRNITSFYLYQSQGFQNMEGWRQVSRMSSRKGLNDLPQRLSLQFLTLCHVSI